MTERIRRSDFFEKLEEDLFRLRKLQPIFPFGMNVFYFYALAKKSGVLHYAQTSDGEFDEKEHIISFWTLCNKSEKRENTPDWSEKWIFFLKSEKDEAQYKKECSKCLNSPLFRGFGRNF